MASPELIEDAVAEILLRIPPEEPGDLVRASVVHKQWRRILTDPAFLRRYREFHRTPPLLGFFHNHPLEDVGRTPRFVATTGASLLPVPEFDGEDWWVMNCHHGRVLIDVGRSGDGLVVWDPITGDRHRVPQPDSLRGNLYSPAVLCGVGNCNHLNCHGGPFLVVGVGITDGVIQVFVYSSETSAWTQPASVDAGGVNYTGAQNGTLIGDELYFTLGWGDAILKYDLINGNHTIAPQELTENAIVEILLRVPPDEPMDLVCASLVHKSWHRILADPAFLCRYRELHRVPPLLGFFHNHPPADVGPMPRFVATTRASPFDQPDFDGEEWWAMNCHHGRVLVDVGDSGDGLVVWDPITGDQKRVYRPDSLCGTFYSPAVLCAVGSCNHLNCHGGPFLVVGVGFAAGVIQVFVYSSESGAWTQPASLDSPGVNYMGAQNVVHHVLVMFYSDMVNLCLGRS
ncbi:hypothetical protein EJB05_14257, partial [Eragrostis curvula]